MKSINKMTIISLIVLTIFVLMAIGSSDSNDTSPDAIADPGENVGEENNTGSSDEEPKVTRKEYGAGTYVVGTDIQPGRYKSYGQITYWERLKGLSGEFSDIIANEALVSGSAIVDIKATDAAFKTEGSGKWFLIDDTYEAKLETSFGEGYFLVGVDIQPGRYRSENGSAYWARLKGFSGELSDIIANSAADSGTVIVEIKSSDVGFQSSGANWVKID